MSTAPPPPTRPGANLGDAVTEQSSGERARPAGVPASLRDHERYRVEAFLGAGGAGTVYRAYDKQLQRVVALKILSAEKRETESLLQEARAQARVEHPHVCKVYEIGLIWDRPYISMQLIDGPTLAVTAEQLSLDEKVQVMRDVADAVHAAHRIGFIHRDVKPGNVMLERTEQGKLTAYVMDFGLARQLEGDVATTMGLAGTPAFMAPEQASGASLDRRTDVYGLGATLYAVLSGRPPFAETSTVDLLMRVRNDEPTPLHRVAPSVPRDLDVVIMKCLERDPLRRYQSARALAEELQRYLDGEPVLARRSLVYTLRKKLRKHRVAATLSALAILGVGTGGWLLARARHVAAERSRVAQILGREMERVDSIVRYAHLLPLHDTRPEKQLVRERMQGLEPLVAAHGSAVPGAVEYALGRGHLALGEPEAARTALEQAWQAGFREPDVAWALGRVYGILYQRARAAAESIEKPEQRRRRLVELEHALRDPALAYLKTAGGAQTESAAYVEALIAYYDRRDDDALAKAALAKRALPWLYEADQLVGDVHRRRAAERRLAGDVGAIAPELAAARAAYDQARAVGRSDAAVHTALCEIRRASVQLGVDAGELRQDDFADAAAACDAAATADPDAPDAPATKAGLFLYAAKLKNGQRTIATSSTAGDDELAHTIALARQALAHDRRHAEAWRVMAQAYTMRADADAADPRAALAAAADALHQLLALGPDWRAYSDLGRVYTMQGAYEQAHGIDRTRSAELAIESFGKSIAQQPDNPVPLLNLGNIYKDLSDDDMARGQNPQAHVEAAIATYRRALALNPRYAFAWNGLGTAQHNLASWADAHDGDPSAPLAEALTAYRKAAEANPKFLYAWTNFVEASLLEADHLVKRGGDPTASLARTREALAHAEALNPDYYLLGVKRASLALVEAAFARKHHRPSAQLGDEALAGLAWARAHHPEDPADVARAEATVQMKRAEWAVADHEDARPAITAGLLRAREAVSINAQSADAHFLVGQLELLAAQAALGGAAATGEHARAAVTSLQAALARNPALDREARELMTRAERLAVASR